MAIALAFAIATYTTIAVLDGDDGGPSSSTTAPQTQAEAEGPPQAPWKISVHGSGANGKLTKKQRARLEQLEPQLRALVRRIYDAVLLHPNRLSQTLAANFTPPAARALRRTDVAAARPKTAATMARKATIGVDVNGLGLAVASVQLRALPAEDARPTLHRSTLWLERSGKGWQVWAFDVKQRPLAGPASTEKSRGKDGARKARGSSEKRMGGGRKARTKSGEQPGRRDKAGGHSDGKRGSRTKGKKG